MVLLCHCYHAIYILAQFSYLNAYNSLLMNSKQSLQHYFLSHFISYILSLANKVHKGNLLSISLQSIFFNPDWESSITTIENSCHKLTACTSQLLPAISWSCLPPPSLLPFSLKKKRELDFNLLMFCRRILFVGQKGTSSVKKFI